MPEQLYSVSDVCALLGISEVALWRLRRNGQIEFRHVGEKYPVFFHDFVEAYRLGRSAGKDAREVSVSGGEPLHWSTQPKKGKGEVPTLAFELYVSDYRGAVSSFVAVLGKIRRDRITHYGARVAFWDHVSRVIAEVGDDMDLATGERLRRKIAREVMLPGPNPIRVPLPARR